ncbi:MAG: phosphatase PAP2 family protein [Planctomycetia bacterium]|nr:phosphatase PAP2 family protein [Planctomycetia bacterium]
MFQDAARLALVLPRYAAHVWRTRRRELVFVGMASLFLFLCYLFTELADEITAGATQKLDESILLALRSPHDLAVPIGPAWLKGGMLDATALGSPLTLGMFSAAMIGFLFMERQIRVAWLSVMAIGGGVCSTFVLKLCFARPRPTIVPHLREVTSLSFPSGHAMLSAVVYLTIGVMFAKAVRGRWAKAYCLFWGALLTLLVGVSRIFLGVHYPSDVVGGWIAGLSWAAACWIVAQFVPSKQMTTEPAP